MAAFNDITNDVIYNSTTALVTLQLILNFHKAVGKELGEHFNAIQGQFCGQGEDVVVGLYRPPQGVFAKELAVRFAGGCRMNSSLNLGSNIFQ